MPDPDWPGELSAVVGSIITFYSYKGGTGRSMAMANTAWILASNGLRVLVVDWDLEAPGLHRYFHPFLPDKDLRLSVGIIDLVWEFAAAAMDSEAPNEPGWYEKLARISPYAMSIDYGFPGAGTIDLVPAGRQDSSYSVLVSTFDWENFYDRLGGGGFLEALKRNMRDRYDYVLIDSRTGLSDTAGICTVQLPDILVNCFSLSTQAIDGASAVAVSVGRQRQDRQVRIFPVPMRVEDGEQDKLDASRDYARAHLGRFLAHVADPERYWGEVEVPYKSFYAYEEILATIGDRPRQENTVLAATERIVGYLTDRQVTVLDALPSESERRALLARFQRSVPAVPTTGGDIHFNGASPKVFISYGYESAEHFEAVRELWFLLRSRGVDARLDFPPGQRRLDWLVWLAAELRAADLILIVMSPTYKRWADNEMVTADDSVPGSEARLVRDAYTSGGLAARRLLPVVLPGGSAADIPAFLADIAVDHVVIDELNDPGVDSLLRQMVWRGRNSKPRPEVSAPWWESHSPRAKSPLEDAAVMLSAAVAIQWQREAATRALDPWPLPVWWAATTTSAASHPVAALGDLSLAGLSGLRLRGLSHDLVEAFLALPSGQLVVLGTPGSGKTTAMIQLVLDLLARRETGPVPVLLPAASWRPDVEHFYDWISQRLRENYPSLTVTARYGKDVAERLVAAGLILPVVDSLDELPEFLRSRALDALSFTGSGLPMVVTCRTEEYQQTVAATGLVLPTAAVIELEPVTVDDAISYLAAGAPANDNRWKPVFAYLRAHPNAPLAQVLSTPLMVQLVRSVYRNPQTDPAELVDPVRFSVQADIESQLLGAFISAVYAPRPLRPSAEGPSVLVYDASSACRWLTFLARWLHEQGTRDLAWWHLHRAVPALTRRLLLGLAGGFFGALVLGVLGAYVSRLPPAVPFPGWVIGIGAGLALGAFTTALSRPPAQPSQPPRSLRGVRQRYLRQLVRPADFHRSSNPRSTLRDDRVATLVFALVSVSVVLLGVPVAAIVAGLPFLLTIGPAAALAVGAMLLHVGTSAWGSFAVARCWLAMRGLLPWGLMRFLDDAHSRDVLRQQGPVYQFRYAQLQDRLADQARK